MAVRLYMAGDYASAQATLRSLCSGNEVVFSISPTILISDASGQDGFVVTVLHPTAEETATAAIEGAAEALAQNTGAWVYMIETPLGVEETLV